MQLNNDHNEYKTSNRNAFADDYFGPIDTLRTKPSPYISGSTESSPCDSIEQKSASTRTESHHHSVIIPDIILIPSPSGTASTASSPGSERRVWDSPETPSLRPTEQLDAGSVTPLTPPTAYELSPDDTPSRKPLVSFLTGNASSENIFDRLASRIPNQHDVEDDLEKQDHDKESSVARKLFTDVVHHAIEKSIGTTTQTTSRFKLEPDLDFSSHPADIKSIPKYSKRYGYFKKSMKEETPSTKVKGTDISMQQTKVKVEDTESNVGLASLPDTDALPQGFLAILDQIIPLQLHARLQEKPHNCVATQVKKPKEVCSRKAKGPFHDVDKFCRAISKCERKGNYEALPAHITELVQSVMCGTHQKSALEGPYQNSARKGPKAKPRMVRLKSLLSDLPRATNSDRAALAIWMRAISSSTAAHGQDPDLDPETDNAPLINKPRSVRTPPAPAPVPVPNPTPPTTTTEPTIVPLRLSRNFLPFQPQWSKPLDPSAALLSIITKALTPTDTKSGFIYIFWDKEHFGYAKIGYTNDLSRRLHEWNTKCKRIFSYHPASTRGELVEIPHVKRIESLMHIELKDWRRQRKCEGCGTNHREWFEVHEAQAVRVFQKWQQWIVQKPYAVDAVSGEWRIRPEMLGTLAQVCEPVLVEVVQQKVGPKKAGTRRKAKRKSVLANK